MSRTLEDSITENRASSMTSPTNTSCIDDFSHREAQSVAERFDRSLLSKPVSTTTSEQEYCKVNEPPQGEYEYNRASSTNLLELSARGFDILHRTCLHTYLYSHHSAKWLSRRRWHICFAVSATCCYSILELEMDFPSCRVRLRTSRWQLIRPKLGAWSRALRQRYPAGHYIMN